MGCVLHGSCVAGLKIPKYDFSADTKEIDELFDPLIQQADEMAQQATKRLGEIKNELKALDAERVSSPAELAQAVHEIPSASGAGI